MFGLLYLLGWSATAAFVVVVWRGARRKPPTALAVLVGLLAGLVWPITLWIAVGVWWRRRSVVAAWRAAAPRPSVGGTIAVCTVGALVTLVAFGAAAPPAPDAEPSRLASAAVPAAPAVVPASVPVALQVSAVVDGDTVVLSDARRVRLLGVDAPEVGECGYQQAGDFARTTLLNRTVQVAADPTQASTDQFGRSLLYVGAPQDYSVAVAAAGWAEHFVVGGTPVQKASQIQAAQQTAQAQRLGIWGDLCAPAPTTTPAPTSAPATTRQAAAAVADDDDETRAAPAPEPRPQPQPLVQAQPRPQPQPEPEPEPEPSGGGCHPSYSPCLPIVADLNCGDISSSVVVTGPDDYNLDSNDDGHGCESNG